MDNPLKLPAALLDVHLSLERGGRVTPEQAVMLLEYEDVLTIAAMADAIAIRKWSGRAFYQSPLRISLRRLCEGSCKVCDRVQGTAVEQAVALDAHEVHLVGLPETASLEEVEALVGALRERLSDVWMQGFTAHEVHALAHRAGLDLDTVAARLQQAGLDGLLGTHEEAFTRQGRRLLHDEALSDDDALAVHAAAHRAGLVSVATLRYAPGEPAQALVARMDKIRETQRKTAGFSVFAPQPKDIQAGLRHSEIPSGYEDMRLLAVGRLFFDNIPHVRVPWLALGLKMGQVALSFGADDLGWTALDAHVRAFAPSTMFTSLTAGEIERAAQAARRRAAHVDGAWRERERPRSMAHGGVS